MWISVDSEASILTLWSGYKTCFTVWLDGFADGEKARHAECAVEFRKPFEHFRTGLEVAHDFVVGCANDAKHWAGSLANGVSILTLWSVFKNYVTVSS